MPDLFPFPGLRYQTAALDVDLGAVTAPPYDVIDEEERARLEAGKGEEIGHHGSPSG